MATPIDPTSAAFLVAENRQMPMHVGALQLFAKPEGAGRNFTRDLYAQMRSVEEIAPLFLKRPHRSIATAGQWTWVEDEHFDIDHHVRHSALPKPGRVRELLDLCSRLHGQRLALERPLWEAHLIEGLHDGRFAMYQKMHHSLVDGVSATRLVQSVLTTDPDRRDLPPPWAQLPASARPGTRAASTRASLNEIPANTVRSGLALVSEAAGLPTAFVRTLHKGVRNETSAISLHAPRTIFNQNITGARRFAAQKWSLERLQGVSRATATTINDVVLAMCGGAVRRYLLELDALPDRPLIAMVPVGLNARSAGDASGEGGNAIGAVMVQLATDTHDPAHRLRRIHESMRDGKQALESMSPMQIVAMSAVGMAPALLTPILRAQGLVRPPFNLIISNVPGPKETLYYNGAEMVGMYPLSIPIHGMALNITCTSYAGDLGFGLTGDRRTVPHLQRLLGDLDAELTALERATT